MAQIPVWYGRRDTVDATVANTFAITLPKGDGMTGVRVLARYNDPVAAPVRAGEKVGEIIAERNGTVIARAPLIAKERVGKVQFIARIIKNISVLIGGK